MDKSLKTQMEKRICPECGTEFKPKVHNQFCCSPDCTEKAAAKRYKSNRKPALTKVCKICGNTFKAEGHTRCSVTCSPKCSDINKRNAYKVFYQKNKDSILKASTNQRHKQGSFKCPKCGSLHDYPLDPHGDRRQYCYPCRQSFYESGWPADSSEYYSIGAY